MKKLLLLCLTSLLLLSANAQSSQGIQRCYADQKLQEHLQLFPEIRETMEAHELEYQRLLNEGKLQNTQRAVRIIPVVVHIIQQNANEEISDARVQTQIDVLNEDFRKIAGTPGFGAGVDYEIEFCLAKIDPKGCPTTGINRLIHAGLSSHNMDDEFQLKSLIQWEPTSYLNMWVPRNIQDGILGYATFPTSLAAAPFLDGVVLNGVYFGRGEGTPLTSYNLGRTATHEVGHWVGLYHTFEGGCVGTTANNCATQGDRVCDTPPTADANYGCPNPQNTCTETPTDLPDQTRNYMDYVNDACMDMFTQGQKDRTESFFMNQRSKIWSAANLSATGCDGTVSPGCVPTADFQADLVSACLDATINFSDLSTGLPTSWEWSFPGGTPSTSTNQNPTITYAEAGLFPVTLKVTNSLGNHSKTRNGYIFVMDGDPTPITESFESILYYPLGWTTYDEDGLGTWELTNKTGSQGTKSMVCKNFDFNGLGSKDQIQSQVIDLRYTTSATLEFDYAYKLFNFFRLDTFRVKVTGDCGLTYNTEFQAGGGDLATASGLAVGAPFVPNATQWKTQTVDLAPYLGSANVRILFECIGRNGQYLYFDRVNVTAVVDSSLMPPPPDTNTVPQPTSWEFTPIQAPFQEEISFQYAVPAAGTVTLEVFDLWGKRLYYDTQIPDSPGIFTWTLPQDLQSSLKGGIYIYRANWKTETFRRMFIRDTR
ncbi:MAG: PKD domain-containing protein [Bacteroidia bacterium]|nr:PKD domain-containing protein [Bacteroidia bacterium]